MEYACFAIQNKRRYDERRHHETKGVTCKIPLNLHNRITEEIRQNESTMSKFIEQIILEHYEKGAITMGKTRTMAFQVSEELFQQIKDYLARYEQTYHRKLTQKEFVIGLIEQALEEADEEFEAAEAAAAEEAADDAEINDDNDDVEEAEDDGQEDEVTGEDEETEDAQPDDTPEEAEEAEDATETCEDDNADDGSAVDADAESSARPQWE